MAIALAGLIFASAIIPTVKTMSAYQEAELDLKAVSAHALAEARADEIAASIWRDADPPAGLGPLRTARADRLEVGDWELRASGDAVQQKCRPGDWAPLANAVQTFNFEYLLGDGTWKPSVSSGQLEEVVAVRWSWKDRGSGLPFGGPVPTPDYAYSAGLLNLSKPDTSGTYRRRDFERTITLSLGDWDTGGGREVSDSGGGRDNGRGDRDRGGRNNRGGNGRGRWSDRDGKDRKDDQGDRRGGHRGRDRGRRDRGGGRHGRR